MKTCGTNRGQTAVAALLAVAVLSLACLPAFAQEANNARAQGGNKGVDIAGGIEKEMGSFHKILKIALGVIVLIGFLYAGGVAMSRGDWGRGLITIGFGILLIMAFFVVSSELGLGGSGGK